MAVAGIGDDHVSDHNTIGVNPYNRALTLTVDNNSPSAVEDDWFIDDNRSSVSGVFEPDLAAFRSLVNQLLKRGQLRSGFSKRSGSNQEKNNKRENRDAFQQIQFSLLCVECCLIL